MGAGRGLGLAHRRAASLGGEVLRAGRRRAARAVAGRHAHAHRRLSLRRRGARPAGRRPPARGQGAARLMAEALYGHFYEYAGAWMFLVLAVLLFSGFPVGLVLGGVALLFALAGIGMGIMSPIELYLFVERLWQTAASNQLLVAVPCFVFMGLMLERSEVAGNLLRILQILLRRAPGGLALAVTALGTILAATTGILGASVVMLSLMALPTMVRQGYDKGLASGTVAASATLGILIPPSIMLVMMGDLMGLSVGDLFLAAIVPGLLLSGLYGLYIMAVGFARPRMAPAIERSEEEIGLRNVLVLLAKGLVPPVVLISLVLGSIFAGW